MSNGFHIKAASFDRSLIPSMISCKPDLVVVVGSSGDLSILEAFHAALGDSCHYGFRAMEFEPWIEAAMGNQDAAETAEGWLDDISIMIAPWEPDFAKRCKVVSERYGYVTFQCLNEQKGHKKWQSDFDSARIKLGVKYKIRIGVCAWGWGQPEKEEWAIYDPTLRAVKAAGDLATLILHNYWPGMDAPRADDPYIFLRPLDLRDYCYAHDLNQVWDKQTEYWEWGMDQMGWRAPGGPLPDKYIEWLFLGDSYTPHIRKAAYDCSLTPDDPGQPHWYSLQENYILVKAKPGQPEEKVRPINLLIAAITGKPKTLPRKIGDPTTPPPQEPPTEPPPTPQPIIVPILNPGMESPIVFGQLAVPDYFEFGYNDRQADVHSEMERHPTHVKSGKQSARMWGVGEWQGWYWQTFETIPGYVYTAMVDTLGTVTDDVDQPSLGSVKQKLTLDPSAGDDPRGLVSHVVNNHDVWSTLIFSAVATGPLMTVFYAAENNNLRRADVFLDNMRVTAVPGAPPPVTDPLFFIAYPAPRRARIIGSNGYWRIRSTPVLLDPPTNETGRMPNNHQFMVDGYTYNGEWFRDMSGGWVNASKVMLF